MNQLNIRDQIIPYEERRSARYRRITLRILQDRLRISTPKYVSSKQLQELLLAKQEWILKHWSETQERLKSPASFTDGGYFLYRGNTIELKIIRHPCKRIWALLEGQVLKVHIPQDLQDNDLDLNVKRALVSWYKTQARWLLQDKLDKQSKQMQVTFQSFRLKEQKTRWGSCSSKKNINLNWQIIMAPDEAMDYIVIHELAHLTHLNHSDLFWQRVATFMPDYLDWKQWFKDHGQELRL